MSHDSYQPPPPGTAAYPLPRRNENWTRERDRDADRDRDRHRGRDSWRPDAPSGGGAGRPPYNGYGNDRDSYRPPLPPPPPPSFGHDNFRPPQSDFHFRVDRPAGITDAPASYRPGPGRSGPRHNHYNNRRDGHGPRRGGPYPRFMASNRPILSGANKATTQDFVKDEAGVTYIPIDELSDSDEADMDISDDEQDDRGSGGEPSHKRQRLAADTPTSADEAPKWSNPDPYFVLPPTDVQQRKKDVVQLIRKARVQPAKPDAAALGDVEPEEFISFDLDDSGDDEQVNGDSKSFPSGAPTAPRGANKPNHEHNQNKAAAPSAHPPAADNLNPSRKRTHNDQLKLELPSHAKLKKVTKMPVGGIISAEWRVVRGQDPCPWFTDHSGTPLPSSRLHREVVDFYEHVKPRDYEQRLRSDLVDKLNRLVRQRFRDAKIYPFGSFMSGLYLPTGDMDLVLCSDAFLKGGRAKYDAKRELFRFRDFLFNNRLASEGEVEVISKARVPIVKYIDKATGLKVDISFENTTGVKAIQTFLDWKEQYPAMPILVTLIKQFLTMRALNEPVNGGIGGFSIICLVVSMFQLMPQVQSRDMIPEHHLGDMLMHFFDLYGKKFNYVTTAIRLNPPGYVPKSMVNSFIYKNPDRLSIIDPNNLANDISGGSSNIAAISRVFSEAYDMLQEQMALAAKHPDRPGTSLLKVILEGNYESFRLQRDYLRQMYEQIYGADED